MLQPLDQGLLLLTFYVYVSHFLTSLRHMSSLVLVHSSSWTVWIIDSVSSLFTSIRNTSLVEALNFTIRLVKKEYEKTSCVKRARLSVFASMNDPPSASFAFRLLKVDQVSREIKIYKRSLDLTTYSWSSLHLCWKSTLISRVCLDSCRELKQVFSVGWDQDIREDDVCWRW